MQNPRNPNVATARSSFGSNRTPPFQRNGTVLFLRTLIAPVPTTMSRTRSKLIQTEAEPLRDHVNAFLPGDPQRGHSHQRDNPEITTPMMMHAAPMQNIVVPLFASPLISAIRPMIIPHPGRIMLSTISLPVAASNPPGGRFSQKDFCGTLGCPSRTTPSVCPHLLQRLAKSRSVWQFGHRAIIILILRSLHVGNSKKRRCAARPKAARDRGLELLPPNWVQQIYIRSCGGSNPVAWSS